jgi:dTDP-4-amino-4,6-dideoxygalactose transaminase
MQTLRATIPIAFVDLAAQYHSMKAEIDGAIASVIAETSFIGGPHVKGFEEAFARYCGVDHCVGVANGTDALFVALKVLDIGPGDEVITAANTFIATAEAITMAGAQVVFVDINPRTFNLEVDRIEEKVTRRTKAIIPVHLYGQPANMAPIRTIAEKHGLRVIGDAAQAHGACYHGKPVAQWADVTCYSFYPGKNLGAYGDAGAVVTNNARWATAARMWANHGRVTKYDHNFEGVNSRLDALQAAILAVKLPHLEDWTVRRRQHAYRYNEALASTNVVTPNEIEDVHAVYHLYVVRVPGGRRDALQQHLHNEGISTGIHYPIALPYLSAYRRLKHDEGDFPEALKASREILSLPIYPELSEELVHVVVGRIKDFGVWSHDPA